MTQALKQPFTIAQGGGDISHPSHPSHPVNLPSDRKITDDNKPDAPRIPPDEFEFNF